MDRQLESNVDGYEIRAVSSDRDLRGILDLQARNLTAALDADEVRSQGFVTLRHDLGLLRDICGPWGHVVAMPAGSTEVAAYALVMLPGYRARIPALAEMFERLDGLTFRGRPIAERRHYMMGQLCVGKAHRGHGLVERLYRGHRTLMAPEFELVVTLIDRANPRSVRVHERTGWETIDRYRSPDGREWVIVALDLSDPSGAPA